MLTVTESAGARLARELALKRTRAGTAMRVVRTERGWRLRVAEPAEGDAVYAHDGRPVLLLDAQAAELLANRTLDTRDASERSKLRLR